MEELNELIERRSATFWALCALAAASLLGGSTLVLSGAGDVVAGVGALLSGGVGIGAAAQRRRLEALPLELAPVVARQDGPLGSTTTVRGWLGRGRRIASLQVRVEVRDGEAVRELEVIAPDGPLVGRFQAVVAAPESGELHVTVMAVEGAREHRVARRYLPDEVRPGRFAAGIERRRGGLVWRASTWPRVLQEGVSEV